MRGRGRHTSSTIHFLFIFQKNRKSTRAWPILKSNSTSFWLKKCFLGRMNNKKVRKRWLQKFKERGGGQGVDVTELKWAGWCPVMPPTLCGKSPHLWRRCARNIHFFYHSFPNIYLFILQIYTPPPVFIIECWEKLHSIQELPLCNVSFIFFLNYYT